MTVWIRSHDRGTWVSAVAVFLALMALVPLALAVREGPTALDAYDMGLWRLRETAIGAGVLGAADLVASVPVWAVVVATVAVALAFTSLGQSLRLVALVVIAELATIVVKGVVDRPRPDSTGSLDLVAAGFPSGHVTRTAVLVGGLLVLMPWCRRHPKAVISLGLLAIAVMGVARVSARAHYTTDVLGACLLTAGLLGAWHLLDASPRIAAASRSSASRAGLVAVLALALALLGPTVARAASPSPSAGSGGDPRSSGQGPGLVGDAGTAILGTLAIGFGAVVVTTLYVRLTPRRRPPDDT